VFEMKTFMDCIPCFARQALDAVRMVTDDEKVHERVLREVLRAASEMDLDESPPAMGQRIHRLIRTLSGDADPYREVKRRSTRLALSMYQKLKDRVERSANPLAAAASLAAAGNVIDLGVNTRLEEEQVERALDRALSEPLNGRVKELARAVADAREILYLADNAGEIVFDRLLVEQMPLERVTVAVRGRPVINDATIDDAQAAGLTDLVEVVANGSDAPGTILADCSEGFRRRFERADVVVAKGQGNYETLSGAGRDIFFLLMVKCPVIAAHLGCEAGTLVLRRSPRPAAEKGYRHAGI
jgi:hypothetical protein